MLMNAAGVLTLQPQRAEPPLPAVAAVASADWLSVWHGARGTAWQTPWPQEYLQGRLGCSHGPHRETPLPSGRKQTWELQEGGRPWVNACWQQTHTCNKHQCQICVSNICCSSSLPFPAPHNKALSCNAGWNWILIYLLDNASMITRNLQDGSSWQTSELFQIPLIGYS